VTCLILVPVARERDGGRHAWSVTVGHQPYVRQRAVVTTVRSVMNPIERSSGRESRTAGAEAAFDNGLRLPSVAALARQCRSSSATRGGWSRVYDPGTATVTPSSDELASLAGLPSAAGHDGHRPIRRASTRPRATTADPGHASGGSEARAGGGGWRHGNPEPMGVWQTAACNHATTRSTIRSTTATLSTYPSSSNTAPR
jgi:hypothetical protein